MGVGSLGTSSRIRPCVLSSWEHEALFGAGNTRLNNIPQERAQCYSHFREHTRTCTKSSDAAAVSVEPQCVSGARKIFLAEAKSEADFFRRNTQGSKRELFIAAVHPSGHVIWRSAVCATRGSVPTSLISSKR